MAKKDKQEFGKSNPFALSEAEVNDLLPDEEDLEVIEFTEPTSEHQFMVGKDEAVKAGSVVEEEVEPEAAKTEESVAQTMAGQTAAKFRQVRSEKPHLKMKYMGKANRY